MCLKFVSHIIHTTLVSKYYLLSSAKTSKSTKSFYISGNGILARSGKNKIIALIPFILPQNYH